MQFPISVTPFVTDQIKQTGSWQKSLHFSCLLITCCQFWDFGISSGSDQTSIRIKWGCGRFGKSAAILVGNVFHPCSYRLKKDGGDLWKACLRCVISNKFFKSFFQFSSICVQFKIRIRKKFMTVFDNVLK